jgi:hypothetical protein
MKRWFALVIFKKSYISIVSVARPKNIVVFDVTYVLESFALFYCDFCMDLYSVDSDEHFIASILRSVKRFIAYC